MVLVVHVLVRPLLLLPSRKKKEGRGTQRCIPRTRLSLARSLGEERERRRKARGGRVSHVRRRAENPACTRSPVRVGARAVRARVALPGAAHALRRLECLSLSLSAAAAAAAARTQQATSTPRKARRAHQACQPVAEAVCCDAPT